jgi:hypothetical protein
MPNRMTSSLPRIGVSTGVTDGETAMTQTSLFDVPADAEAAWRDLKKYIAQAVEEIGHKEVAYALDVSGSYLSHCLAERERHSIPLRWLPVLLRMGRTDDLLGYLAALRGREVVAQQVLTPEEELTRMKQALLKNFGPAGADLIRKDVFGSGR